MRVWTLLYACKLYLVALNPSTFAYYQFLTGGLGKVLSKKKKKKCGRAWDRVRQKKKKNYNKEKHSYVALRRRPTSGIMSRKTSNALTASA